MFAHSIPLSDVGVGGSISKKKIFLGIKLTFLTYTEKLSLGVGGNFPKVQKLFC